MLKKILNPFVLLPIGMFVFLLVQSDGIENWGDAAYLLFAGIFLAAFALSAFGMGDGSEATWGTRKVNELGEFLFSITGVVFWLAGATVLVVFGWVSFFVLKPDATTPIFIVWAFRIFWLLFVGFAGFSFLQSFPGKNKAGIFVSLEKDNYFLGEQMEGEITLTLPRDAVIREVVVKLVAVGSASSADVAEIDESEERCVESQRFAPADIMTEKNKLDRSQEHWVDFNFHLFGKRIELAVSETTTWQVQCHVVCSNFELKKVRRIEIEST